MKTVQQQISSVFLALVVLLSTVSFTVDSHYCGGILVDSSLFGHVETCAMAVQQQPSSSECDISKKDCCSDEQAVVEGQDNLKMSFHKMDKDQQLFVAAFIHTYINLFFESQIDLNYYKDYTPPLLVWDIHVLEQTFLI